MKRLVLVISDSLRIASLTNLNLASQLSCLPVGHTVRVCQQLHARRGSYRWSASPCGNSPPLKLTSPRPLSHYSIIGFHSSDGDVIIAAKDYPDAPTLFRYSQNITAPLTHPPEPKPYLGFQNSVKYVKEALLRLEGQDDSIKPDVRWTLGNCCHEYR